MTTTALAADLAHPLRDVFLERSIGALRRIAQQASPEGLRQAIAAPTDIGTLARVLAEAGATDAVRSLDPTATALARAAEARGVLAERAGGLLPVGEVARLLGISRQAVDKRRAKGRLLAMRVPADWHYPAAQFAPDGAVAEGLAEVIAAFAPAGPWATLDFLCAPDAALEGATPMAALHAGRLAEIRRLLAQREADAFG